MSLNERGEKDNLFSLRDLSVDLPLREELALSFFSAPLARVRLFDGDAIRRPFFFFLLLQEDFSPASYSSRRTPRHSSHLEKEGVPSLSLQDGGDSSLPVFIVRESCISEEGFRLFFLPAR